jgi:hypothetical protein
MAMIHVKATSGHFYLAKFRTLLLCVDTMSRLRCLGLRIVLYHKCVGNRPLRHYGARSKEFGYANYQILPKGPVNLVNLKKGELQEQDKNIPPAPGVNNNR